MEYYGRYVTKLIEEFGRLPGIGYKTARRLAVHMLQLTEQEVETFAETMVLAKQRTCRCSRCFALTDEDLCSVCRNLKRDASVIMVVEETKDLVAYEKTGQFKGYYHVLQGVISPMLDMGADDLTIKELLVRLADEQIKEVILATNSTIEGETTAIYIRKLLKDFPVAISRIANGVPVGGDLDYVDEITLARALEGRRNML